MSKKNQFVDSQPLSGVLSKIVFAGRAGSFKTNFDKQNDASVYNARYGLVNAHILRTKLESAQRFAYQTSRVNNSWRSVSALLREALAKLDKGYSIQKITYHIENQLPVLPSDCEIFQFVQNLVPKLLALSNGTELIRADGQF